MRRTAVVTGIGTGIGAAIFQRLMGAGYFVVGIEIDADKADAAREVVGPNGAVLTGSSADQELLVEARARAEQSGTLEAWVNNAGIALGGNLHDPQASEIDRLLQVNLMGVFWGCSTAIRSFIENGVPGAVVNVSSIHGRAAFPGWAAYDMAKGGVDALTRYAAVEYGPVGIRVNAVAPGAIRTDMVAQVIADSVDPGVAERDMAALHPLERLGETSEIAAVVAFLVSNEASFVSGQSIAVDGAATARCYRYEPSPEIKTAQQGGQR